MDTGSGYTLIKKAALSRLGCELNTSRALPNLQAVTGTPLHIFGMVNLEIGVGDYKVCKQWVPVVPDHYLGTDVLLGVDVLGQAFCSFIR